MNELAESKPPRHAKEASDAKATSKKPSRVRGVKRVQSLLAAAEQVFAEHGYGASSMNGIAQRARAPIGSLYQFFPSKIAIGGALVERYTIDLDEAWQAACARLKPGQWQAFADTLLDTTLDCIARHPAFAALNEAQVQFQLRPASHGELEAALAAIAQRLSPKLDDAAAATLASVTLQMLKSAYALHIAGEARGVDNMAEISVMLGHYFETRLG